MFPSWQKDRTTEIRSFCQISKFISRTAWKKTGVTTKLKFPGDGQRLTTWTALHLRIYGRPCILVNAPGHGIPWRTLAVAAKGKWSTIHFYLHDLLKCSLTLEGMWTLFGRPRPSTFVDGTGGGRHATRLTPDILLKNRFQKSFAQLCKYNYVLLIR